MTGGGPTEDKSTSSKEASVRSAEFWTRANNVGEGTSEVPLQFGSRPDHVGTTGSSIRQTAEIKMK